MMKFTLAAFIILVRWTIIMWCIHWHTYTLTYSEIAQFGDNNPNLTDLTVIQENEFWVLVRTFSGSTNSSQEFFNYFDMFWYKLKILNPTVTDKKNETTPPTGYSINSSGQSLCSTTFSPFYNWSKLITWDYTCDSDWLVQLCPISVTSSDHFWPLKFCPRMLSLHPKRKKSFLFYQKPLFSVTKKINHQLRSFDSYSL